MKGRSTFLFQLKITFNILGVAKTTGLRMLYFIANMTFIDKTIWRTAKNLEEHRWRAKTTSTWYPTW